MTTGFNTLLAFTMVVGAARADATRAGKFEQLRQAVIPTIPEFRKTGDGRPIIRAIRSVLGEEWTPEGEWSDYIKSLMEERTDGS